MFPPPPPRHAIRITNFDFSPKHSIITTFADNIGTTYLTNYGSLSERCILNTLHHFRESHKEKWLTALQRRSQSSVQSQTKVVYRLHGQTGRFMVWVNGSQSSGLVNFVPELAFNIYTNQSHLPENGREGLKLVSKFPFGIFHPEKQDYLFRCSVAPGNFPLGRPKKWCSIYFNFCKW